MSKFRNLPVDLDIDHYYWNPFSMTITHYNSNGTIYDLTGKTITAGIKTRIDNDAFAVSFSVTTDLSEGEVVLTRTSASLLASLVPNRKYYWDYRIDGETIINGDFVLRSQPGQKDNSLSITFRSSPAISLTITQSQTVIDADITSVLMSGTTAERLAYVGLFNGQPWYDTELKTNYHWDVETLSWV